MITYEEFKELYDAFPGEPEFEIHFSNNSAAYMIIKYDNYASFQRCGYYNGSEELEYENIDTLYHADLIDGLNLERDWETIDTIILNASIYLGWDGWKEDLRELAGTDLI